MEFIEDLARNLVERMSGISWREHADMDEDTRKRFEALFYSLMIFLGISK
jgi:hypothetical protein